MNPAQTKRCPKCKKTLPVGKFYKANSTKSGLQGWCKGCSDAAKRAYYLTEQGKLCRRGQQERYYSNPDNKERARITHYIYRRSHRKEYRCQMIVLTAMRNGSLVRPSVCEQCGQARRLHAHHPDYNEPLRVVWLCPSCHGLLHSSNKTKRPFAPPDIGSSLTGIHTRQAAKMRLLRQKELINPLGSGIHGEHSSPPLLSPSLVPGTPE